MDISQLLRVILGLLCFGISGYVFYRYFLTVNDALFSLGLSMVTIAISIFCSLADPLSLWGMTLNVGWLRYIGSISALCFMFLSIMVTSNMQMRLVKIWQIIATILFLILLLITPALPPFPDNLIPALFNLGRPLFCLLLFCRYITFYISKEERFTLVMSIAFLVLGIGYALVTPQLLDPAFILATTVGETLRIMGYSILVFAYIAIK